MSAEVSHPCFPSDERELLGHLLDHIPDRIYFKDRQSRFIRVNRAWANMFKLHDPADAVGKTDFDFHSAEHARDALADEQKVMESGEPMISKVEKITLPDGKSGWALTTKMPLCDAAGQIIGTFGLTRDYTELKKAQDDLARAHDALTKSYEELKETQLQLIEAEKMSSVGRLAAGIAHEVKNPLAMIRMGVDYVTATADATADENLPAILKGMTEGIDRADAMIGELQAFASSRGLVLVKSNLESIVLRSLELVAHDLSDRKINVVKNFDPGVPELSLDRGKITQVLIHLLTNAAHAMPDGGTLTISTRSARLSAEDVSRDAGNRSGAKFREDQAVAIIEIDDTGTGIDPGKITQIFEPFFTTKPTGQGVGLGLTVSQKIMELHGGTIEVANRGGGGAKAIVRFKTDGL